MLSKQPFDMEYLKQVIADLEKAKEMLDKEKRISPQVNIPVTIAKPKPKQKSITKTVVSDVGSALMQGLQKDLLAAIFPIGGQLFNVGLALFNDGILNDKQRKELGSISKEIMNLPFKLLTGEIDLNGVISGLTKALESLFKFFVSNPDIAIKAGSTILPSLIPLGGFLSKAFSAIAGSDFVKSSIGSLFKKGLDSLSKQFTKVEDTLEKSALQVTHGVHGKIR